LIPLAQIILGGMWMVELPVSSKLQMLSAVRLCLGISSFKFSESAFPLSQLKLVHLVTLVASGFLRHKNSWYFFSLMNHMLPAQWFFTYLSLWHNYTVFFAMLKGKFQKFLLCGTANFRTFISGCVLKISRGFFFLKLQQMMD
jgi:hypothetical protein